MSINESEPYPPVEPEQGLSGEPPTSAAPRPRWRPRSVVIAASVGALVIACGATGIAATARVISLQAEASSSSSSAGTNATLLPQRGSSGAMSRATETTSATPATAAQSVGIVVIDTVLKYEGAEAAGTGIVLTPSGEILTNNHVIDGATGISVTVISTGKTYTADVVGTDATSDIAVLQLEGATGLATAALDSTSEVAVSDAVTAVGNAGGTGALSAAAGTVTAVDQTITAAGESGSDPETLHGLIETDADVVSGDSGGPLYDTDGEVIGIDTAASSGSAQVTGYAIPIATALGIVTQIESGVETDQITIGYPAFLGVAIAQATGTTAGATISGVVTGTPAESAGLVAGDTITTVNGTAITSGSQLSSLLGGHEPGDSVTIGWTDAAGSAQTATVTLIEGAAD
ncbi:trypsin-like peptidase domain-containing protein [soil metagenome]